MNLFIKKLIFLALIVLFVIIVPAVLIDPYNVYHWKQVRENGIEPNRNYIKMKYLLSHSAEYDALLFGSSRIGAIHVEKIPGVKAYNMSCSMGTPDKHLRNLITLIDNGFKFKRIYLGIDNLSLLENDKKHRTFSRCSYEYLNENPVHFIKLYTNPISVWKSLQYSHQDNDSIGHSQMYKSGWVYNYKYKSKYDWSIEKNKKWKKNIKKSKIYESNMDLNLQSLEAIKAICEKDGIELIVFTNPLYKTVYLEAINYGYLDFLRKLVQIVPFYNFSGLCDITVDDVNFVDNNHYNAEVGDLIINVICRNKRYDRLYEQGFGWYVTRSNIGELIQQIDVN